MLSEARVNNEHQWSSRAPLLEWATRQNHRAVVDCGPGTGHCGGRGRAVDDANSFNEIATELSAAHDTTEVAAGNALSARAVLVARRLDETLLGNLKNMTQWVALPSVVRAAQQGAATADELTLTLDDIETLERIRANDRELGNDPAVPALLSTLVSSSDFVEIFFTEAHGYTVAGSNPTSDFVQSDEEWWQVAWDTGFYAGQPEFDHSANAYIIPFAMRIDDRVSGQHLGVMKLGLDISNLQALAEAEAATLDQGSILIFDRQTGERVADTLTGDDLALIHSEAGRLQAGIDAPMIVAATLQPDEPTYATPQPPMARPWSPGMRAPVAKTCTGPTVASRASTRPCPFPSRSTSSWRAWTRWPAPRTGCKIRPPISWASSR